MNKFTKFGVALLAGVVLTGCSSGENNDSTRSNDDGLIEVTIPSYKTGQNVGAKLFLGQVERFNKQYEGKYKINIEEVPQDAYGEQIQQLAQQNQLPAIVHAPGSGSLDNKWFEDVIIENDMYHDLSEWLEKNPNIQDMLIEEFVEFNQLDNGNLVSVPEYRIRSPFFYYNETMVSPDNEINQMNLEEFDTFLTENELKIAFMTGENAWTTGLFWSALIANLDGGQELLDSAETGRFTDLSNPIVVESITLLKEYIQNHATNNAVGAIYADAANAFMSSSAALIPNGPWMTVDFAESESDKWSNNFQGSDVRGTYFPGNIGLRNSEAYGEWIPKSASDSEKELAEEWLTFLHQPEEMETALLLEGGQAPNVELSDQFFEDLSGDQILTDIMEQTNDDTVFVPNILDLLPSSVAESDLSRFLPLLINDELTPEEFAEELEKRSIEAVQ